MRCNCNRSRNDRVLKECVVICRVTAPAFDFSPREFRVDHRALSVLSSSSRIDRVIRSIALAECVSHRQRARRACASAPQSVSIDRIHLFRAISVELAIRIGYYSLGDRQRTDGRERSIGKRISKDKRLTHLRVARRSLLSSHSGCCVCHT